MGTAHYLSPEQAQGLEVGPESDLYSVGVILYECLTGRVPSKGDSAVAIALRQLSEQPPAPSAWNPDVAPALDAVVMKALRRDPFDRYHDADEFIAALDAAEQTPTAAWVEPEKNNPWPWVIAAVAAVLIGLILWGMLRDNTVEVPKVTGSTLDSAVSTLNADGFSVGEVDRVQRDVPVNRVLDQDPVGKADRDCAFFGWFCSDPDVNLTVSAGPGQVEVPNVAGQTRQTRQSRCSVTPAWAWWSKPPSPTTYPADTVIETSPAGGETVRRGTQVTLVVSSGPSQVAVPPVVGQTLNAAQQQISARGLESTSTEEDSDQPAGEVISQSPNAGTRVDPGSTVSLVVSRGPKEPATVDLPNVVGQLRSDAVSELRALGLQPDVQEQSTDIEPQNGRVIDQNPGGGSSVKEGTRVVVVVGVFQGTGATGSGGVPAALMRVAVLIGGRSSEHEVSLRSGEAVAAGLRPGGPRSRACCDLA